MVTKTTKKTAAPKVKVAKEEKIVPKEKINSEFSGEYFYAVGKRKTAVAQVRIYPTKKAEAKVLVNGKDLKNYIPLKRLQDVVISPFIIAGQEGKFDVSVKVNGGGVNAQSDAMRLGISRALIIFNPELRKSLKVMGFLTRDARKVERKKPGKRKARRSPQWAKR